MNHVLRHLRRAALLTGGEDPPDAQLVEAFLARRDEAAFEVLLRRHGPMVLGVCRRVLRNLHDAEDAFQATFLVLSRQAASIRSREVVASWLYGVAYRTATKARAMNAKRRAKERHAGAIPHSETSAGGADEALLEQLDYEMNRLPEKYRVPIVLCELEGKSRKEVACLLGVPEGTLSWRLAQAKKMLAKRLSRHGAALSVGAIVAAMPETLSLTLRASTVKAVLAAGPVPAQVLALTERVMRAMLLSKLKITFCAAALMLMAGVGATGLTYRATAQQPALASRLAADELEALRLEIEALRKSLQATRERVKTLEGEVSALKEQSGGLAHVMPDVPGNALKEQSGGLGHVMPDMPGAAPRAKGVAPGASNVPANAPGSRSSAPRFPGTQPGGGTGGFKYRKQAPMGGSGAKMPQMHGDLIYGMRKGTSDPLGEAEAALKKLRENPGDTKATAELERALKRLKEQEKQRVPGQSAPGEKK